MEVSLPRFRRRGVDRLKGFRVKGIFGFRVLGVSYDSFGVRNPAKKTRSQDYSRPCSSVINSAFVLVELRAQKKCCS